MTQSRFNELQAQAQGDQMELAYRIFIEEKQMISRDNFNHLFPLWLGMFGGKNITQAIEYFRINKIK